jgi:hypothetical protein
MPVLAEIVASPLLAAAAALVGAHGDAARPIDPCRPPSIRLESADRSTLPGPDSPACKAALEEREKNKQKPRAEKSP